MQLQRPEIFRLAVAPKMHAKKLGTFVRNLSVAAIACVAFGLGASSPAQESGHPELLLPLGHSSDILCAAMSPDGKLIATGDFDGTVILWDAESGRAMRVFTGHRLLATCLVFTSDNTQLLSGAFSSSLFLWDVRTGKQMMDLGFLHKPVHSAGMSATGKRILIGTWTTNVILMDLEAAGVKTLDADGRGITSVALSLDGTRAITGSWDHMAIIWDTTTKKQVQSLKTERALASPVAISRDGKLALTGSGHTFLAKGQDGKTVLVPSREIIADLNNAQAGEALNEQKYAVLWNCDTGKALHRYGKHRGEVAAVALSSDARFVVTGSLDETAILWNAEIEEPLHVLRGHSGEVTSVAIGADNSRVLTASRDRTARLWNAATGKCIRVYTGNRSKVVSIDVDKDAKHVILGNSESQAILWDVEHARRVRTFDIPVDEGDPTKRYYRSGDISSVNIRLEQNVAATSSKAGTALFWDVAAARSVRGLNEPKKGLSRFTIDTAGDFLLAGYQDGSAILWQAKTGKMVRTFTGHRSYVTSVAIDRSSRFALTGSLDNSAILWNVSNGQSVHVLKSHTDAVQAVAFSADGKRILTGSSDNTAIVWDARTGKSLHSLKGHSGTVSCVSLSPDSQKALTGSDDGTAMLWDVKAGKLLQTFSGHRGHLTGAKFLDESKLITSSEDGACSIWTEAKRDQLFSFVSVGDEWLCWTPEGYYACSPKGEQLIAWKVDGETPGGYRIFGPEQFRKSLYRPDLFPHLFRERDLTRALARADKERGGPVEAATTLAKSLPPIVIITDPKSDGETDRATLTVEAVAVSVGERPVTRMSLLLDGRPYRGNLSTFEVPEPRLGKVRWSKAVDLEPGEHTLQVIAESISQGRSDILRIRRKALVESLPRLFVLAVGISAYEKEDLRKDVYYAAADARKFADTVERSSKLLYREVTVVRLIDQDASKRNILRALSRLKAESTQRDAVMIYFAGHGKRDDQNNFYFLPVDTDLGELPFTGLSEGEFKPLVKAITGRVILLLDACHSGSLIENPGRGAPEGLTDRLYLDLTSNEYGLVMMCSSRGLEKSLESSQHKSGYFTVALVEGLEGKARKSEDGAVYFKELDVYVTERVKTLSEGKQHTLTSQAATITNIPLTKP